MQKKQNFIHRDLWMMKNMIKKSNIPAIDELLEIAGQRI